MPELKLYTCFAQYHEHNPGKMKSVEVPVIVPATNWPRAVQRVREEIRRLYDVADSMQIEVRQIRPDRWLYLTPSAADRSTMEQAELNRSTTQPRTDYANDD